MLHFLITLCGSQISGTWCIKIRSWQNPIPWLARETCPACQEDLVESRESAMARAVEVKKRRVLDDVNSGVVPYDNSWYFCSLEFCRIDLRWFQGAKHSIITKSRYFAETAANVWKIFFPQRQKNSITMRMQAGVNGYGSCHVLKRVNIISTRINAGSNVNTHNPLNIHELLGKGQQSATRDGRV